MKAWLLKLFGDIGEYLSVLFDKAIKEELKIVLPIATKLVRQVAADPTLLSGSAKRDAVIAGIIAELAVAQTQVGLSIISLAIELAYTRMKVEQPK